MQAWQVAWGGHALAHQPLDYFQANTFWPLQQQPRVLGRARRLCAGRPDRRRVRRRRSSATTCSSSSPTRSRSPARTCSRASSARAALGAAVAGAAFAYAPWRLEQDGHLHVLSSGGIPLSLFLLAARLPAAAARGTVLAGWLVAAWQFSLGFTLGLQLGYLLAALGADRDRGLAAAAPRRPLPAARLIATAAGVLVVLLAAVAARAALPAGARRPSRGARARPPRSRVSRAAVESFLAAPEQNLVWGKATARRPRRALLGARADALPRRSRSWRSRSPGLGSRAVLRAAADRARRSARSRSPCCRSASTSTAACLYPYRLLYELAAGLGGHPRAGPAR